MEITKAQSFVQQDPWSSLKQHTDARIALGHTGTSIPLKESLNFKLAHAHARDAVYASLSKTELITALELLTLPVITVRSKADSRQHYLQRTDLGRLLHEDSVKTLSAYNTPPTPDVVFILADGLSAHAINKHAIPLLQPVIQILKSSNIIIGPFILAEQARVAISDEIGSLLKATLAIILIGERPGLSSHDSLGVYLTHSPTPGLTDESRNCISNIRPQGLNYQAATQKIIWLIKESLQRKLSGVNLKDHEPVQSSLPE